jgi:multisubunit Na+/H+ antiporter MnhC subunit
MKSIKKLKFLDVVVALVFTAWVIGICVTVYMVANGKFK